MKNKWLEPKGITAIIVMIAALAGAIVVTSTYITLPKDVEALEEDVANLNKIADYYYRRDQEQQQQYQKPYRQQAPPYPQAPQECWEYWTDGYKYPTNCETGEWK